MLILTRKPGESIFVVVNGELVKVTIVELKGNQIRVGIDAPPSIRIYREEIWEQILEENKRAAVTAASSEADDAAALPELPQGWATKQGASASALKLSSSQVMVKRKRS